jgi:hypothetical protein
MWIAALLAGCAPEPHFVEPPGPLVSPSLAGCTFSQDTRERVLTWKYAPSGRLMTDRIEDDDGYWLATYTWEDDCLVRVVRSMDGSPEAPIYDGSGPAYWGQETHLFTCDARGNWVEWERRSLSPAGDADSTRIYRYINEYDANDQLARVQIQAEESSPWLAETGSQSGTIADVSYLWYDERRPLEAVFQDPAEGGSNTATWIWDHDRLLGWDLRGSGSERTMTRLWTGDQLVEENYTEEDAEIAWFEYTYESKEDRFPSDLWVGGSTWPSHPGLPQPPDAIEFIGGLSTASTIEVECR